MPLNVSSVTPPANESWEMMVSVSGSSLGAMVVVVGWATSVAGRVVVVVAPSAHAEVSNPTASTSAIVLLDIGQLLVLLVGSGGES